MTCQSLCAPENTLTSVARQLLDSCTRALLLRLLFACAFAQRASLRRSLGGGHFDALGTAIATCALRHRASGTMKFAKLSNEPLGKPLQRLALKICSILSLPGWHLRSSSAEDCIAAAGHYGNSVQGFSKCPAGSYAPTTGMTTCIQCALGQHPQQGQAASKSASACWRAGARCLIMCAHVCLVMPVICTTYVVHVKMAHSMLAGICQHKCVLQTRTRT